MMNNTIDQQLIDDAKAVGLLTTIYYPSLEGVELTYRQYTFSESQLIKMVELIQARANLSKPQTQNVKDALDQAAAVLPNGKTCTNVYEAYNIGLEQAANIANSMADDELTEYSLAYADACKDIAKTIRALIQKNKSE